MLSNLIGGYLRTLISSVSSVIAKAIVVGILLVAAWLLIQHYINYTSDLYQLEKLKESQQELLNRHKWVTARVVSPADLQRQFDAGFSEGKSLATIKIKPVIVTKWRTQEGTTETSPCGDPGEGLSVVANITEAVIQSEGKHWSFKGNVKVHLAYPFRGWESDLNLPIDRNSVDFKVSEEIEKPPITITGIEREWHLGKAIGCGVGVTASVNAWPAPNAGAGVGAFCGVVWGAVK